MAGTDSGAPFCRIEELEQENEDLRERLEQADEEIDLWFSETRSMRTSPTRPLGFSDPAHPA
jgi:hypothetical protein